MAVNIFFALENTLFGTSFLDFAMVFYSKIGGLCPASSTLDLLGPLLYFEADKLN